MMSGTGLKLFQQKFEKRFFDVGIAEQHAVTMAAGLATGVRHLLQFIRHFYKELMIKLSMM